MGGLPNEFIPIPRTPYRGVVNRRPQIEHIVWGRRAAWSPLWWWPCFVIPGRVLRHPSCCVETWTFSQHWSQWTVCCCNRWCHIRGWWGVWLSDLRLCGTIRTFDVEQVEASGRHDNSSMWSRHVRLWIETPCVRRMDRLGDRYNSRGVRHSVEDMVVLWQDARRTSTCFRRRWTSR